MNDVYTSYIIHIPIDIISQNAVHGWLMVTVRYSRFSLEQKKTINLIDLFNYNHMCKLLFFQNVIHMAQNKIKLNFYLIIVISITSFLIKLVLDNIFLNLYMASCATFVKHVWYFLSIYV